MALSPMPTVFCPYCNRPACFTTWSGKWPVWECKPCDARVGCHRGTPSPLGTLANAELRAARNAAHRAFDPLWKKGGPFHRAGRGVAYAWLAGGLGLRVAECHIAMFDLETCERVVKMLAPLVFEDVE